MICLRSCYVKSNLTDQKSLKQSRSVHLKQYSILNFISHPYSPQGRRAHSSQRCERVRASVPGAPVQSGGDRGQDLR